MKVISQEINFKKYIPIFIISKVFDVIIQR